MTRGVFCLCRYLATEWLELAGGAAQACGSALVTPQHFLRATAGDPALCALVPQAALDAAKTFKTAETATATAAHAASAAGAAAGAATADAPAALAALAAAEEEDEAAAASAFEYPVFCVSAMDFQKGEGLRGPDDGPPAVFQAAVDTEVPALRRFLQQAARVHRAAQAKLAGTAAASAPAGVHPKAGAVFLRCHEAAALAAAAVEEDDDGGNEEAERLAKRHKADGAPSPVGSSSVALSVGSGAAAKRLADESAAEESPPKRQEVDADSDVEEVVAVGDGETDDDEVIDLT